MTFDGREHPGGWCYPARRVSRAPLSGAAVGEPLRASIISARHQGQSLGSYYLGRDLRRGTVWSSAHVFGEFDFATYLRFRALIPQAATHVSALVGLTAIGHGPVTVHGRIAVDATTGTESTLVIPSVAAGTRAAWASAGAGEDADAITMALGFTLTTEAGARRTIALDFYGDDPSMIATQPGVQLFWASVWWEARG